MANDKLTDRQQQVLDYIRSYIEKQGYPPSIRDIGKKMKIASTQGVVDHLNAIEKKQSRTRRPEAISSRPVWAIRVAVRAGHGRADIP